MTDRTPLATESTIKVFDPSMPDPDIDISAFDERCETLAAELDLGLRAIAQNLKDKFGVTVEVDGTRL